jgi:hypothetical protein
MKFLFLVLGLCAFGIGCVTTNINKQRTSIAANALAMQVAPKFATSFPNSIVADVTEVITTEDGAMAIAVITAKDNKKLAMGTVYISMICEDGNSRRICVPSGIYTLYNIGNILGGTKVNE